MFPARKTRNDACANLKRTLKPRRVHDGDGVKVLEDSAPENASQRRGKRRFAEMDLENLIGRVSISME